LFLLFPFILFAQQETTSIILKWHYPDTSQVNLVNQFAVVYGRHTWNDGLTQIVLTDTVYTQSKQDNAEITYDVPPDSAGFQFFFQILALGSENNVLAQSDTLERTTGFPADINGDNKVDGLDHKQFYDAWLKDVDKQLNRLFPTIYKPDVIIELH